MNSRTTINIGLLALVAVLGAVAWLQPGLKPEAAPITLTRLKAADIAKVRIERASTQSSAFEKRGGKWWMTQPISAPVNDIRLEGVLRIAEAKSAREYPAREVDLTKAGLEQPEVTVSFNNEPSLAFGDIEPLNQQRYVRVGDKVFLIDDIAYYNIIGNYTTFIDPSILPGDAAVTALRLPGLTLTHDGKGWEAEPLPEDFSADLVNALVDSWRHAQAIEIRHHDGEGRTEGTVTIQLAKQEKPLQFEIMSQQPELVLARRDLQLEYHFPSEMAKSLLKLPEITAPDSH
jgi:hypothetical protein